MNHHLYIPIFMTLDAFLTRLAIPLGGVELNPLWKGMAGTNTMFLLHMAVTTYVYLIIARSEDKIKSNRYLNFGYNTILLLMTMVVLSNSIIMFSLTTA